MNLLLALLTLTLASTTTAHCPRSFLVDATAKYIAAQTAGNTTAFSLLTTTPSTTPNPTVLAKPLNISHARSFHDTTLCATFTELIVASPTSPYVIGTRILFNSTAHKAHQVETIATKPGDWAFNATGYLHWNALESWAPIPADKRDSRATIQAAGDAYFNRFQNVSYPVPFGTPCARLEGGAYTDARGSGGNTCDLGLPSTLHVTNRRYVIDEEMGAVAIYLGFPGLDRSVEEQPMPDSHLFRTQRVFVSSFEKPHAKFQRYSAMTGTEES
ncbi:hypothetical protein B0T17DRAFT_620760 [Bombardia bombarda]|uniref:DUF8021 domain-containing protein n=1 Tax=Bombardia bombarda TaxID=252184 RepID=A0AA39TU61_9PEZI|nr:hypothetical protein B0T17DRAFT_620760 [Bombardia bombarda]